ncbi:MAG: GAF domain-containing protein [Bacteroidota bacterium]
MNIGLYKRPRLGTVLTTIYVAGIVVSATMINVNAIIGITFLSGVLAIYFTARTKEEVVVYLEKKIEERIEAKESNESQLDEIAFDDEPQNVLNEICGKLNAGQGAIYVLKDEELQLKYGYAINFQVSYKLGEGLVGRVAAENERLYLDNLPDNYITVFSGLGNASPKYLAVIPITNGVIELATFTGINESTLKHIEASCSGILK